MNFRLEICAGSIESAINAQTAGAGRIELCDNLMEGGTTPSSGTIKTARENLSIGIHVIIRPRGGDFLYSGQELEIMRRDIEICGERGIDGVVLGILRDDGNIDIENTAALIELARPMSVTFHRAFDLCSDPFCGLRDVILTGADRLLTSGQKNTAPEGAALIRQLVNDAGSEIIIMPGSGLNETNIAAMASFTGAREFHLSGRKKISSKMTFRREGIAMGSGEALSEYERKEADTDTIRNIIHILKLI
jgi:copper homeostasis protein